MKDFDKWNELKKELEAKKKIVVPKEREVYWASIGENIGFEQNGKGNIFSRPVLIVKRFSKNMFFGIPLSTQIKEGNFFYTFTFLEQHSNALLVQGRIFDTKRLENRLGMIDKSDFENIKKSLRDLLNV
ncbi:MAG: type II toxin-antitoxin system PemK/MazF family toxin [Campylobacterales bacterium]|nr:type II toxin-antitoxin system PemK/MazF family toxin [Campylobacterales bacterium]